MSNENKALDVHLSFMPLKDAKKLFRGGKLWKDFCEQIRNERGNACEICGKSLTKVIANVHHRVQARTFEEYANLESNRFILLCTNCHEWVHAVHNAPYLRKFGLAHLKIGTEPPKKFQWPLKTEDKDIPF